MKIVTLSVLAGAYLNQRMPTTLTHAVALGPDGYPERVMCTKVAFESIADLYSATDEQRQQPPTCKPCRQAWLKEQA